LDFVYTDVEEVQMDWFQGKRPPRSALLLGICALLSSHTHANALWQNCFGCHGPGGVSQTDHMPTIAGLNFRYFYATMQAFRKDRRQSTIMGRIAKGYKTSQLQTLALYFGRQPWTGRAGEVDPQLATRGSILHRDYCEKCHKQNGRYQDRETPPLAGQAKGYLLYQMIDYRQAATIMPQPPLMQERLEKLSDDDLVALSEFYASNPPEPAQTQAADGAVPAD
jgi:sulfide dehydrogenase cytochrome subunit